MTLEEILSSVGVKSNDARITLEEAMMACATDMDLNKRAFDMIEKIKTDPRYIRLVATAILFEIDLHRLAETTFRSVVETLLTSKQ